MENIQSENFNEIQKQQDELVLEKIKLNVDIKNSENRIHEISKKIAELESKKYNVNNFKHKYISIIHGNYEVYMYISDILIEEDNIVLYGIGFETYAGYDRITLNSNYHLCLHCSQMSTYNITIISEDEYNNTRDMIIDTFVKLHKK